MTNETDIASFSDIRDNARAITQMVAFKAWKERIDGQIRGRQAEALKPMVSVDQAMERNYQNAEAVGLMQAVMMWEHLIEEMETEIRRVTIEEENPK